MRNKRMNMAYRLLMTVFMVTLVAGVVTIRKRLTMNIPPPLWLRHGCRNCSSGL